MLKAGDFRLASRSLNLITNIIFDSNFRILYYESVAKSIVAIGSIRAHSSKPFLFKAFYSFIKFNAYLS